MQHTAGLPIKSLGPRAGDVSVSPRRLTTARRYSPGACQTLLDKIRSFGSQSHASVDPMVSMLRLTDKAQHLGTDEILPEIFALVVQAVRHALGIQTSDEQIIAGLHLLRGSIVQMNAGEGKSISHGLRSLARKRHFSTLSQIANANMPLSLTRQSSFH